MGNKPVSKMHLDIISSEGLRPIEIFIHLGFGLILFQSTGVRGKICLIPGHGSKVK